MGYLGLNEFSRPAGKLRASPKRPVLVSPSTLKLRLLGNILVLDPPQRCLEELQALVTVKLPTFR